MSESCIFCRIAAGSIPARLAYEDDQVIAFHDIDAQAPVHVLVIPREHIASVNDLTDAHRELVGSLYLAAKKIAKDLGVAESGYRLVLNCGAGAGQSVDHIHLHVLGGRKFKWPPG